MRILLVALFILKSTLGICQYDLYEMGSPKSYNNNSKKIINHSIRIIKSETYIEGKFMGNSFSYYDTLGRISCYDNSDSTNKIYYSGFLNYDSTLENPKKFIGFGHNPNGKFELNFISKYQNQLLISDSSDLYKNKVAYQYDSLGREINELCFFNNNERSLLKGYSNNKLAWVKDVFKKNGKEYLDSHKIFHYDKNDKLIRVEELIENNDNTSNTNRGSRNYFYNQKGLLAKIEETGIVFEYEYNDKGLLSKSMTYLKDIFSSDKKNYATISTCSYTFY
jgi:hypothetical protein